MIRKVIIGLTTFIFMVFCEVFPQSGIAESDNSKNYRWDKFSISAGGFLTTMNSDLQIGSEKLGLGILVNLEDALGLQTSTFVFRSEAEYFFGRKNRNQVLLSYFSINRRADKTIGSDIEIGNTVYPLGTLISSKFNLSVIKAGYAYSFYKDKRVMLNAKAGLYMMPVSFTIEAFKVQKADFIAPLPLLGIESRFYITPKLILRQSVDVLYVKFSVFEGSISDILFFLDYKPVKHLGIGMGFNAFRIRFEGYDNNKYLGDIEGTIKTGVSGLMLYGRYFF